jgi:hypothetical protein
LLLAQGDLCVPLLEEVGIFHRGRIVGAEVVAVLDSSWGIVIRSIEAGMRLEPFGKITPGRGFA